MKTVVDHNGEVIYVDTDSILFRFKEDNGDPLESSLGDSLGTLTDEYPHQTIEEFVCSGNKSYAIKLKNNKSGADEYIMKSKGITLDSATCHLLNYNRFREMVISYYKKEDEPLMNIQMNKIRSFKEGAVQTIETRRCFRPLITKGNPLTDGRVKPFGFFERELATCIQSYDKFKRVTDYQAQNNEPYMEPYVHALRMEEDEEYRKKFDDRQRQAVEAAARYDRNQELQEERENRHQELLNRQYERDLNFHAEDELRKACAIYK